MKRVQILLLKARRALRRLVRKSPGKTAAPVHSNAAHGHADETIQSKRNISRFFVEQRHITWVLQIGVCVWGFYSYKSMPGKAPDTPVKTALVTPWPEWRGEDRALVTRKIE